MGLQTTAGSISVNDVLFQTLQIHVDFLHSCSTKAVLEFVSNIVLHIENKPLVKQKPSQAKIE